MGMTTQIASSESDWVATQWASTERTVQVEEVPKWTLWQWASAPRRTDASIRGRGDSVLSGGGHNPSGQRWTVGYSGTS
jgi:hypothetical protein